MNAPQIRAIVLACAALANQFGAPIVGDFLEANADHVLTASLALWAMLAWLRGRKERGAR